MQNMGAFPNLTCSIFSYSRVINAKKYYLEFLYLVLQIHLNTKRFLIIA